jgi:hypothetical protein
MNHMDGAGKIHPRYVVDEKGRKTDVVLPLDEYVELMEDLEDLSVIAERREEPTVSHEELLDRLKKDGLLSD